MSQTRPFHLLLVEDDLALAELVANFLSLNNFDVSIALTAKQARHIAQEKHFDIIVCDVMLPDGNGFVLIKDLFKHQQCPVIFLTALGDDDSQIEGFDAGAVDYIPKPVNPSVLLARIKANLKKIKTSDKTDVLQFGTFVFDHRTKSLMQNKEKIAVTNQEFDILWLFVNNLNQPLPRDFLFQEIVGREYDGSDRAADLKISRLRKKLQLLGLDELVIESIRNQGYVFSISE
ncbi:response regulator transcription factor [Thalassotalea sp. G2M2-11]|uniref:response regulator transcription factor n=1 Tax=Thalassotalea sp. G2M2-11 TaxID=2787627 RepID=UPI0019CF9CDF|nr:response regulator transcription factor [Thalassotalea sp. G2M2-11]